MTLSVIQKIYARLLRRTSKLEQRGEYSAGYWQDKTRRAVLQMSLGYQGRLLEVGCGEGFFLSNLIKANPHVKAWGIDNRMEILKRAQELFFKDDSQSVTLIETQAQKLPFDNSFFDAVVCINVLICIGSFEEVRRMVGEISRVCKPGGKLIIEFRNKLNPLLRFKYALAKYYDATAKDHPLSTYDKKDIIALLSEFDFQVSQERCIDFPVKKLAPIIILEAQKNV
jgi:ubiquinone/menaquinone biosynthesis C-methylase UbiE